MSAFNCSQIHYQYLADGLAHLLKGDTRLTENYSHAFRVIGLDYEKRQNTNPEKLAAFLVAQLQGMNSNAVAGCYQEKPEYVKYEIIPNASRGGFEFNILQLIKALNCTLYQCAEYPVIESEQYQNWQNFANELAASYVRRLAEYDNAEWEITKKTPKVSRIY